MTDFEQSYKLVEQRFDEKYKQVLIDRGPKRDSQGLKEVTHEISHIFAHGVSIISSALEGYMLQGDEKASLASQLRSGQRRDLVTDQNDQRRTSMSDAMSLLSNSKKIEISTDEAKVMTLKLIEKIKKEYGFGDKAVPIMKEIWEERRMDSLIEEGWDPFETKFSKALKKVRDLFGIPDRNRNI